MINYRHLRWFGACCLVCGFYAQEALKETRAVAYRPTADGGDKSERCGAGLQICFGFFWDLGFWQRTGPKLQPSNAEMFARFENAGFVAG